MVKSYQIIFLSNFWDPNQRRTLHHPAPAGALAPSPRSPSLGSLGREASEAAAETQARTEEDDDQMVIFT